jgi:branched-chain amino acid transport system ATP-binding protein
VNAHPISTTVLEAVAITKRYGGLVAVDDMSVVATAGEVAALIGPNGAGKTTLFRCLAGAERPDTGRVLLDGRDITRLSPDARARRGLGRTFQRLAVFPTMTVDDNLQVGAENRTSAPAPLRIGALLLGILGFPVVDTALHRRRVDEVVAMLGLEAVRSSPAGALPTGTLRLVELGRALCHDPKVLLLDEPASGLDSAETDDFLHVIRDVAASGVAVVIVEHDVELVFDVADRVYAMAEGRLLASGSPDEVRADPGVRAAYLDTA